MTLKKLCHSKKETTGIKPWSVIYQV